MVVNISRYIRFLNNSNDVISAGSNKIWEYLSLALLVFFLIGYLFVAMFVDPDLMVSLILFFGSLFVALMLTLMFELLKTAKENSLKISELLVGVIDARDPNLDGHSHQVMQVTMVFYKYLPERIKNAINETSLRYAALMHDIGKMGVPEAILNKPAKLDEEEWALMRQHPRIGVEILKPVSVFDNITDWILYHHERPDGKGYYDLQDEEIPLPAKIIAIADTYSAITMRRSYKEPKTHDDAIAIIRDVAGTQLDKELVDIFVQIPKQELISCLPEKVSN